MAKISTSSPVYDAMKPVSGINSSSLLSPDQVYKSRPKTPPAKRAEKVGANHQVSEKHKNFKRRDTPMAINVNPSSKSTYQPKLPENFSEEEENYEENSKSK